MPQELLHPPAVPGNTQATAKHRAWLPPWMVVGGAPGRPNVPALPPVNTALPFAQGTAQQGQTLTCTMGIWTNIPEHYGYAWMRGATVVGTADTYTLVAADVGNSLFCEVTAMNSGGQATANSNSIGPVIVAAPTNIALPVVTGTLQVGATLTCSNGTWTGVPTGYSYQWMRGGIAIGTNQNTYVPVAADINNMLNCIVTATNAGGSTTASAAFVGPILPSAPVNTLAPAVTTTSLSVAAGGIATTTNGTWSNNPTAYNYQWVRQGGTNIGTNANSYTFVAADESNTITCNVTAINTGGQATAASNAAGPVTP